MKESCQVAPNAPLPELVAIYRGSTGILAWQGEVARAG